MIFQSRITRDFNHVSHTTRIAQVSELKVHRKLHQWVDETASAYFKSIMIFLNLSGQFVNV